MIFPTIIIIFVFVWVVSIFSIPNTLIRRNDELKWKFRPGVIMEYFITPFRFSTLGYFWTQPKLIILNPWFMVVLPTIIFGSVMLMNGTPLFGRQDNTQTT